MIKVENEISHIKIRKEIVFLPYKASMWDSLESVYLAAKEDEECDAYVIPVSYYNKLPGGRLWKKKILGLGSPKLDKVQNKEKEDLEILDEWLKIIEKSV